MFIERRLHEARERTDVRAETLKLGNERDGRRVDSGAGALRRDGGSAHEADDERLERENHCAGVLSLRQDVLFFVAVMCELEGSRSRDSATGRRPYILARRLGSRRDQQLATESSGRDRPCSPSVCSPMVRNSSTLLHASERASESPGVRTSPTEQPQSSLPQRTQSQVPPHRKPPMKNILYCSLRYALRGPSPP